MQITVISDDSDDAGDAAMVTTAYPTVDAEYAALMERIRVLQAAKDARPSVEQGEE